jgi:branched-chain amino acid transport system ATP-binding protein
MNSVAKKGMKEALVIKDLNLYYGGIHALKDINLKVMEGEIITLIGANGAGKTSTLRAISGLEKIKSGSITFDGKPINEVEAHKLVAGGLSHVPEGRKIFGNLTVMENLELGAYLRKDKEEVKKDYELIFEKFPILKERIKQNAGTLSGGQQQMLAIGRALMNRPKMLLLDEPSMGLAPMVVKQIFDTIVEINKTGTTILLVEQNANMALSIADRAYVLETGSVVLEGDAKELMKNDKIRAAYLGE